MDRQRFKRDTIRRAPLVAALLGAITLGIGNAHAATNHPVTFGEMVYNTLAYAKHVQIPPDVRRNLRGVFYPYHVKTQAERRNYAPDLSVVMGIIPDNWTHRTNSPDYMLLDRPTGKLILQGRRACDGRDFAFKGYRVGGGEDWHLAFDFMSLFHASIYSRPKAPLTTEFPSLKIAGVSPNGDAGYLIQLDRLGRWRRYIPPEQRPAGQNKEPRHPLDFRPKSDNYFADIEVSRKRGAA